MISVEKALSLVLENIFELPAEPVPTEESAGRVLAVDLKAREGLPPFENSAMDGFAVRAGDLEGASPDSSRRLKVRGVLRAGGAAREALGPGEALKIMTGAALPPGADAVVMKEFALREAEAWVEIGYSPSQGENIRPRWEDVRPQEPLLARGTLLRPYEISLLAAQGLAEVPVIRRPVAAVLSTGDELVDFRRPELLPGQIRDSNGPALAAALSRWGARARRLGPLPDEPGRLRSVLEGAREGTDLLIVSGGVSVGDFDFTRSILSEMGLETVFWKVAMKPGKPLLFGLLPASGGGLPVFGLPGNPVSALVCLEEFVRPAMEKMQGKNLSHPSWHLEGTLENGYRLHGERRHFLFCRVRGENGGFALQVIRPQGSAMIGMACGANALATVPADAGELRPGDRVSFRWLK